MNCTELKVGDKVISTVKLLNLNYLNLHGDYIPKGTILTVVSIMKGFDVFDAEGYKQIFCPCDFAPYNKKVRIG